MATPRKLVDNGIEEIMAGYYDRPLADSERLSKLYQEIIPTILNMRTETEVCDYLLEKDIDRSDLYILALRFGQDNKDDDILKKKIWDYTDSYYERIEQERLNKNSAERVATAKARTPEASSVISEFIKSGTKTIEEFCEENNITRNKFATYRDIITEYNPELLDKYNETIEKQAASRYAKVVEGLKKVKHGIINGVIENDELRPYDIVDYYLATKLPPEKFVQIMNQSYAADERRALQIFFRKNEAYKILRPKSIIAEKHIINNCEITENEKREAMGFLISNGIPLYDRVYITAIRRHLAGRLIPGAVENSVIAR